MAYESVDKLQNILGEEVFYYAKDKKKAAGRALGTLVEIITYYLLKTWGFDNSIAIERGLVEYGNEEISHNVEYSFHPLINEYKITLPKTGDSLTATKILKEIESHINLSEFKKKNNNLLDKYNILRNACTIAESKTSFLIANLYGIKENEYDLCVYEQLENPYAIFECKRVGIEEGAKKGPQTIEKAKQGAYVARMASSLQKIRTDTGEKYGIIYKSDTEKLIKPYQELIKEIIYSHDKNLLKKFILTIGIVSNHGNWFTAQNQNKELKVLSHSYDWLIFLTDNGLAQFIDQLLLNPSSEYQKVKDTFLVSYAGNKKKNIFTKVKIDLESHNLLIKYFNDNINLIEKWFNIIAPENESIEILKSELLELSCKNWSNIRK